MTDTSEQWAPVPGHPGYEISTDGVVRSSELTDPYGRLTRTAFVINQFLTGPPKAQYMEVSLRSVVRGNAHRKRRKVHHLVLEAFVGPRPPGLSACHNNDNKIDNRLSNLRWDTHAGNMRDKTRNGSHPETQKTHCKYGHERTPENVYPDKTGNGRRRCKLCAQARAKAQYAAKIANGRPETIKALTTRLAREGHTDAEISAVLQARKLDA